MHLHRHEAFQPVRHRRALHPERRFGNGRQHARRRLHRGPVLAEEHRPVEHEVVVVRKRQRVPGSGGFIAFEELPIGSDGAPVPFHHRLVVPALDVDVGGHVPKVAPIGHELAQAIGGAECVFRMRGHLQGVDVHVQQAGMVRLARGFPDVGGHFERLDCLQGIRSGSGLARLEVPQGPGRAVDQCFGEQRAHVRVPGKRSVHLTHRVRVVVVPPIEVAGRIRQRIPSSERLDEHLLDRLCVPDAIERLPRSGPDRGQRGREIDRIELGPWLVVIGSGSVRDPPPRHRAAGVVLGRPPEAAHRFFVGEGVTPHETPVEPALRLRRASRDAE